LEFGCQEGDQGEETQLKKHLIQLWDGYTFCSLVVPLIN
jgi:hypothetical protein